MISLLLRLRLAAVVFVLSLILLLISAWPLPREQYTISLPALEQPDAQQTAVPLALPEMRQITVEWPASIRVQDGDWVVLSLTVDPAGDLGETPPAAENNLYELYNIVAVGRLELPGTAAWSEAVREPLRPGRPVTFRWAIRADSAGVQRGVLWLSMEFVPLAGGAVETLTILSRQVTVDAVSILGMSGFMGRAVGGVGILLSIILVSPMLARFRSRRQITEA